MSQNTLLKLQGLYTFPSHLSAVPSGALLKALNIVINRDSVAESRRGFKIYGSAMDDSSALTAHQLLNYKGRILRHFGNGSGTTLEYDSDGNGNFSKFNIVLTGDTHASTTIDAIVSTSQLEAGMYVTGLGIPDNTTVVSITDNVSLELSQATTSSDSAVSLTFYWNISEVEQGRRIKSVEQNGNFYFTTSEGIKKISTTSASGLSSSAVTPAGGIKALDVQLDINATPGFLSAQSVVAYRVLWGIEDSNNNLILGTPSSRTIIRNTDAVNPKTVDINIPIPRGVTTAHFYQVYRTAVFSDPSSDQDPGDEEQLVYEANPTNTDLTNGYVMTTDITPESFRVGGANLYTNQNSGEGILQANDRPPLAKDVTAFKGYTFYANTQTLQRLNTSLLSVVQFVSNTSSLTITDGTVSHTYTFRSASDGGEDVASRKVLFSPTPPGTLSPAQQVEQTARSLVKVINGQDSEVVYAYYISGSTDVPGLILLEARELNQSAFYLNVDDSATTGIEFSPAITSSGNSIISTNEALPNRLYYSKFQQPEAVPIVNFIDVGPQDKAILRILALRDSLFILKEDGVYRLSGLVSPFTVYPFDFSVSTKSPDSAVVLNNLIYLYSSQGVGTISDTGVSVISRPIEDDIVKLLIPSYSNFSTATFGLAYESDRSYYLFTVTNTSDTHATQCFRYNSFTNTWTKLDLAKRCGIVNSFDDQMYLGPTDTNFIEQERKSFDRTDFSDREIQLTLGSNSVNGVNITLPSLVNISTGDVLVQNQYITIRQITHLLTKLDRDSLLTFRAYASTFTPSPGASIQDSFTDIITQVASDTGRLSVSGHTSSATYLSLLPAPSDSLGQQSTYNSLVTLLNSDVGVGYKNYIMLTASSFVSYEFNIISTDISTNSITSSYVYPLVEGPVTIYNHIGVDLRWAPQYLQDVSITKHVSEGTLIFEDSSFTTATLSYATDLSANFEDQDINGFGNGIFGNLPYGEGLYGGSGSGVPFRTFLPKEKQRCRYLNVGFKHSIAREVFSLYGLSLTYNPMSQRGYR